jgi:hypothetical protein
MSLLDEQDANAAAEFYSAQQKEQPDLLRPRTLEEFTAFAKIRCLYGVRNQNGALVATGYVLSHANGAAWEIGGFAVDEAAQMAGVGTTLARFALADLIVNRQALPESIFADVRTENPNPRGPLRALGFAHVGQVTQDPEAGGGQGHQHKPVVTDRFRFTREGLSDLAGWMSGLSAAQDREIQMEFGSTPTADIEKGLREAVAAATGVRKVEDAGRPDNRLQTLMMGLVYPAFFGTFLVSFGLSSATLGTDQKTFAVFLLVYFMAAYVETQTTDRREYRPLSLAGDVLEIALMAALFIAIGVATLDVGIDIPVLRRESPSQVWALLAALFAIPPFTRTVVYRLRVPGLDRLCLIGMALAVAAAFRMLEWAPLPSSSATFSHPLFMTTKSDLLAVGGVWILLLIYLFLAIRRSPSLGKRPLKSISDVYTIVGVLLLAAAAIGLLASAS